MKGLQCSTSALTLNCKRVAKTTPKQPQTKYYGVLSKISGNNGWNKWLELEIL